jgi:DNA-binding NtrC family response regulator
LDVIDCDKGELGEKIEDLTSLASALLEEVKAILPAGTVDVRSGVDFYEEVKQFEIELIQRALDRTGGHQTRAANLLKIKITTLNSKIKRYHIDHISAAS